MYAAPFEYHAPATVADAVALLKQFGEDAKVVSGSQSLVPLMKLRLASLKHLVDLRKVPGLTGISERGDAIVIGGMTTHQAISASELIRKKLPMMAEAAGNIGDVQVRNMGTIGGSLAHADPSADWPAVLTALDASVQIASGSGERTVKVDQLIVGPLTTVLQLAEILTHVRVPLPQGRYGGAYEKLPHPASRFAVVGVAVEIFLDARGAVQSSRIALTGLGPKVSRATGVEQALQGKAPDPAALKAAAARAAEGIELRDDLIGSAAYRANLAAVYAERALKRAVSRALERANL
jgi:carbon-monoxide dehydrogenase medium subunit